jgi:thymidine kinase
LAHIEARRVLAYPTETVYGFGGGIDRDSVDALIELKAVCECGRKATMNLRVDAEGHAVAAGAQTEIGGNDRYVALCRRHFFERLREGEARQLSLAIPRVTGAA